MDTSTTTAPISPLLKTSRSLASFKNSRANILKPLKCTPRSSERSFHAPKSLIMPRNISYRLAENSPSTIYVSGYSGLTKTPEPVDADYNETSNRRRVWNETPSSGSLTLNNESKDFAELRKTNTVSFSRDYSSSKKAYLSIKRNSEKERSPERTIKIKQYITELSELLPNGTQEPSAKRAKLCYRVLDLISSEEGQYQKEMSILKEEINNTMFCYSKETLRKIEEHFPGVVGRGKVFNLPYFELVARIMRFFESYQKVVQAKFEERQKHIESLNQEIQAKNNTIQDLLKDDNNHLEIQTQKIENAYEKIVKELEVLKKDRATLSDEIYRIRGDTADMLDKTEMTLIDQYGNRLRALLAAKNAIQESTKEKDVEIEKLKSAYSKLVLVHQNSIVKLKANKQELDTLKARVQELEHENSRLAVRAAVGFDQLTPRPQLDSIVTQLNIEIQKKDSTQKKIEMIDAALQEMTSKSKPTEENVG